MPSLMECSINNVIKIFHQYSKHEDHPDRLSHSEFKELVQKELPNFLKKSKDEKAVRELLEDLDTSGDKQLSFEEFATLIGPMTQAAHKEMHKDEDNPVGDHHSHGPGFGPIQDSCQSQGGHSH